VVQERAEVDAAQAKSATSAKVTASAAGKPKLKSSKVILLFAYVIYFPGGTILPKFLFQNQHINRGAC